MLCQEATAHQKSVRCPRGLSCELTRSFMFRKVAVYVFKIALDSLASTSGFPAAPKVDGGFCCHFF